MSVPWRKLHNKTQSSFCQSFTSASSRGLPAGVSLGLFILPIQTAPTENKDRTKQRFLLLSFSLFCLTNGSDHQFPSKLVTAEFSLFKSTRNFPVCCVLCSELKQSLFSKEQRLSNRLNSVASSLLSLLDSGKPHISLTLTTWCQCVASLTHYPVVSGQTLPHLLSCWVWRSPVRGCWTAGRNSWRTMLADWTPERCHTPLSTNNRTEKSTFSYYSVCL